MPKRTTAAKKDITQVRPADALKMLAEDHRRVADLFEQCIAGHAGKREALAREIFQALEIHSTLEEELFYPALQQERGTSSPVQIESGLNGTALLLDDDESEAEASLEEDEPYDEEPDDALATAYDDHQAVKQMILQLRSMEAGGEDFDRMMAELQSLVLNHVEEEEEVIFPEARLALDIDLLGRAMQQRKQELLASAGQPLSGDT
jgi:hemerythrin superfamily protein